MKYLCLIYFNEAAVDALSQSDWDVLSHDCKNFNESLARDGQLLGCDALQSVFTATTVRMRNGKLSTTDGPFAETKEQLGGYCLIDAGDMEEALEIAGRLPPGRFGCVEVRPVRDLPSRI
jgi:hypothetical protein